MTSDRQNAGRRNSGSGRMDAAARLCWRSRSGKPARTIRRAGRAAAGWRPPPVATATPRQAAARRWPPSAPCRRHRIRHAAPRTRRGQPRHQQDREGPQRQVAQEHGPPAQSLGQQTAGTGPIVLPATIWPRKIALITAARALGTCSRPSPVPGSSGRRPPRPCSTRAPAAAKAGRRCAHAAAAMKISSATTIICLRAEQVGQPRHRRVPRPCWRSGWPRRSRTAVRPHRRWRRSRAGPSQQRCRRRPTGIPAARSAARWWRNRPREGAKRVSGEAAVAATFTRTGRGRDCGRTERERDHCEARAATAMHPVGLRFRCGGVVARWRQAWKGEETALMNDATVPTAARASDARMAATAMRSPNWRNSSTSLLRLRTFPIGMKLFEDLDGDGERCPGCAGRRRARRSPPASW